MSTFLFQTRGKTRPEGKPRVYFACHQNDFNKAFNKVCSDILGVCDCAIYYTENMDSAISEQDKEFGLKRMNLLVVPVTRDLLTSPNRVMSVDVPHAKENGIPVLPLVFETGLVEIYSQNTQLGELQYLDPFSSDPTELSYEEKLNRFIRSVLISEELSQRIRDEFDAYIFLSYRKKDRYYANKLMQLIHDKPECRDIAIWFDEYLTPSQNFRENIFKMLDNSKIFALLVTPNILQKPDGKPNFVMREEYPAALDRGMIIVPAEMETTDKAELSAKFKNIPECVDPCMDAAFRERLQQALSRIVITTNDNIPVHNYLIGLAYRDGIDVEVNRQRGLDLIVKAAKAGLPEAAKELVTMYFYGSCIPKSIDKAQFWQRELIEILRKQLESNPSTRIRLDLIDALRFLTEIVRSGSYEHKAEELISYCTESLALCEKVQSANEYESSRLIESKLITLRSLAIAYENAGDFGAAFSTYQEALELRKAVQRLDAEAGCDNTQLLNTWRIAQIHHDIGILYKQKGEYCEAVDHLETALGIYEEISKTTVAFLPNMIAVHNAVSTNAIHFDIRKAIQHCDIAVAMSKSLWESHPKAFDFLYANTLYLKAVVLGESGKFDEIGAICLQAKDLLNPHREEGSRDVLACLMNISYKLASVCIINGQYECAEPLYLEGVELARTLMTGANADCKESIAHLYFDYGTLLSMQPNCDSLRVAKDYLQKAMELFADVSLTKASCQMYVIETEIAIRELGKKWDTANSLSLRSGFEKVESNQAAGLRFIRCLNEGEKAERGNHYEKALLNYKAASQELELYESVSSTISKLELADLYDRIAVCCEAVGDYAGAKENFAQAVLVSSQEARETENSDAFTAAIAYLHKLAGFCEEFGDPEEAETHRQFCVFLETEKARAIPESTSKRDSAGQTARRTADTLVTNTETDGDIARTLDALLDVFFGPSDEDDLHFSPEEARDIEARFDELFGFDNEPHLDREDPFLITLSNENGQDVQFRFADLIDYQGNEYVVLIPLQDNEVVILHAVPEYDDSVSYLPVEDESLLAHLFEIFRDKNKNSVNFVE